MSLEDILEVFPGDLSDAERALRKHTLKIIARENDKSLIRDVTLIVQDLESNTGRKLVHGTGKQRLFVFISEDDEPSVHWEKTSSRRIVNVLWQVIKIGGVCFASCLFYRNRHKVYEYLWYSSLTTDGKNETVALSDVKSNLSTFVEIVELVRPYLLLVLGVFKKLKF